MQCKKNPAGHCLAGLIMGLKDGLDQRSAQWDLERNGNRHAKLFNHRLKTGLR